MKALGLVLVSWAVLAAPLGGQTRAEGGSPSSASDPVDRRCSLPSAPDTLHRDGPTVLLRWELPDRPVYHRHGLPDDSAFLAYRAAVRADGADLRRPVADQPEPADEGEAALWRDERINHELAQTGEVGSIEPVTCLDALLFALQHRRFDQIERPTEFLASVLMREAEGRAELAVIFGAGGEMFPPKSVYGFDVVESYRADGWRWLYALHNHTIQRNGDRLALGNPTLSINDVQLTRGLAADLGLESARVTNGFYTFTVPADELGRMKSR